MNFKNLEGKTTGNLFPTGNTTDTFEGINVTCFDLATSMMICDAKEFNILGNENSKELNNNKKLSLRNDNNLRNEQIGKVTSIVAKMRLIRDYVNRQQIMHTAQNTEKKGFVIDGRDIGSVVFKNADLKLFIEVKPNVRAKRRHKQLIDLGEKSIYAKILKEIKLRDKQDKARSNSPLVIPKGANIIDNSGLFNDTLKKITQLIGQIT